MQNDPYYLDPEAAARRVTRSTGGEGSFGTKRVAVATYDFAVEGGAISTINLSALDIPAGAILTDATLDVITVPVGAGATISLGVETNVDLLAATAISGAPWSTIAPKDLPLITGAQKTTVARKVKATIAAFALTAGKFTVYVEYIDTRA